ncbi:MAG: hypothetical protein JWM16_771 [Verrucomicrobiales bacterium]|nr:hypothetical protein [Verrucomicrobiales bacterium]
MNSISISGNRGPLLALQRLARARKAREICELCSVELSSTHRHLFEVAKRQILCACPSCALTFENVAGGRLKLIPRDVRDLPGFQIPDAQWDVLALPIGLAFFFYSTPNGRFTAMYPSPAGATESLLPVGRWQIMVCSESRLDKMQADVEALLVNRTRSPHSYYLVPIDVCYKLVGLIRVHWRGLSGGEMVWLELERFYEKLSGGGTF